MLGRIDPGGNLQDEAFARGVVERALEHGTIGRNLDVEVAQMDVAQQQRADLQVRIELRGDANLPFRCAAGIRERHRIRQRLAGRDIGNALRVRRDVRTLHADGRVAARRRGGGVLQILQEVQCGRTDRLELRVEQADTLQVLELRASAGIDVQADELVRRSRVGVGIVGCNGTVRHRAGGIGTCIFVVARFDRVERGHRCRRAGLVAVPLLHLGKEAQQACLRGVALVAFLQQDASAQHGVQAHHLGLRGYRRRFAFRQQHAAGFQCREPALLPLALVGGEYFQGDRRTAVLQDAGTHLVGVRRLFRDELVAR